MWNEFEALMTNPNLGFSDLTDTNNLNIAVATLMVHAAFADEEFHENESHTIRALLQERFGYDDTLLDNLIINAGITSAHDTSLDIDGFIQSVNENLEHDEIRDFFKMIWRIIIADGRIHPHEQRMANMLAPRLHIGPLEHEEIKNTALGENAAATRRH